MKKITKLICYLFPSIRRITSERDNLLKENKLLLNELRDKTGYKKIFLSPWTDVWKDFYVRNFDSIESFLDNLKANLDEESRRVVDEFWEKIIFMIPYNKYKQSYLYKYNDFFSNEEIEKQKMKIDVKYKLPRDVDIDKTIFLTKNGLVFLEDSVLSRIKNGLVIDGGGYIGDSALVFSEYLPKKIYSFEPVDYLYKKAEETIKINNLEHLVKVVKIGLSNRKGKSKIYGEGSCSSFYDVHIKEKESQVVATTTIDQFFQDKEDARISLIKLDVEGSEFEAIEGALKTIKKNKPILLISIYHRPKDFFFIKPMIEKLEPSYNFIIRKTSPFRVTSETVLIGYVD